MPRITGTVREGRVELDEPVNLPDGTRVVVTEAAPEPEYLVEEDWPDTPENRAELLRRLDAIEPLGWTDEEETRIKAAWAELKRFNIEAVRKQMGLDQ